MPSVREAELQDRIRLALAQLEGVVLWRNNVGVGYVGQQRTPVRYGLAVGSADLVGLVRTDGGWGRFIALEVKTSRGMVSDDQARWLRLVQRLGGYAVVVRSVEDAIAAVEAARRTGDDETLERWRSGARAARFAGALSRELGARSRASSAVRGTRGRGGHRRLRGRVEAVRGAGATEADAASGEEGRGMTLEWEEEDQPEEGVMWRAQDGSFVAEIREYEGGYLLHVEVDAFNLSDAKRQAWRIFEILALPYREVSK